MQNPYAGASVWLVGFRMASFVLSGSGIRVFVLGNMELGRGGWGKYRSVVGVCVVYLLDVLEGCSCQFIISSNALLKASRLWINALDWSLFHCAIVQGEKLYL